MAAVKRVWSEELATYTADEVRRGLEVCRVRDWPPTLPEFLKACRPPLDYEAAFLEAVEQMRLRDQGKDQWSSAVVYWAAVRMGRDLSQFPYLTIKGRWQSTLDAVKAEIASGALANMIPQRAVALPDSSGVTISKEKAKAHIDAIMAQLAKKMTAA